MCVMYMNCIPNADMLTTQKINIHVHDAVSALMFVHACIQLLYPALCQSKRMCSNKNVCLPNSRAGLRFRLLSSSVTRQPLEIAGIISV